MSDHSWVHIQIVTNIALRLARLLFRRGVEPAMITDHGLTERDAEVVIAAGALLHCLGMAIHRQDHERFSLFLAADKLPALLAGVYEEPERTVVAAEAMHAIISHRSKGDPLTIEGAIVRVADALDMAKGRARLPFEAGETNIHSLSAYAIEEVKISAGRETAVRSRSTCRTAPGSSRSTRASARSSAAPRSSRTSRSSRASTPSTRSAWSRCSASRRARTAL